MARIGLRALVDGLGGAEAASGEVQAFSSKPRWAGADVVLPQRVVVKIVAGVPENDLVLEPSGGDWYWTLTVITPGKRVTRHVAVPSADVDYGDLVDIDPETVLPDEGAIPAWTAAVGEVVALSTDVTIKHAQVDGWHDGTMTAASEAESSAARAETFAAETVELQDAAVAELLRTNGSSALSAVTETRAVHDLTTFLLPDELFPNDGIIDARPLFDRAFTALRALTVSDPRVQELYVPGGKYRIASGSGIDIIGASEFAERIAMRGESRSSTILMPVGNNSAFFTLKAAITPESPTDFWFFRDVHFADFTVDARGQNVTEWPILLKAFQGGGWLGCTWSRITGIGTTATMYGMDYPVNCTVTDCWAIGSGRGFPQQTDPVHAAEMRSGFGIAYGHFDNESITFIGGGAKGCSRSGSFHERQDSRGSVKRTAKITYIGFTATGNGNGITDAGGSGLNAIGCELSDNAGAGLYVGPNTQARASGLNGRVTGCNIMGNGVAGIYATGTIYDDTNPAVPTLGGYVIEGNRIESNGVGILAKLFETVEAGGLTIRGNRFVRNVGAGIDMNNADKPVRELSIIGNDFDGNGDVAVKLLVPMTAPRIEGNDCFNSDGVQRQKNGVVFHPAEVVTVPRIQKNTWRGMAQGLVNSARFDQSLITENLTVANANDPAMSATYVEYLSSTPQAEASTLGAGWAASLAGGTLNWTRTAGGCRVSSGSWGEIAGQVRNVGTSGIYVESYIHASVQGAGKNRFRGVTIGGDTVDAIIAGVDDVSTSLGAPQHYALWLLRSGVPTLLGQSTIPAIEGHKVALGREPGSTVTKMFIDGTAVYGVNIPEVPVTTFAGVAGAAGPAGNVSGTPSSRLIRNVRIVPVAGVLPTVVVGTIRNMATNPSFEVVGSGIVLSAGTGGAANITRVNDAAVAHSGVGSSLITWATATTNPAGGGAHVTAFEDVEVGKVYTLSAWVRSSRARKYRPQVSLFTASGATGTYVSAKNGAYVDVPANTWVRVSIATDSIPAGVVSVRLQISAASLVDGGVNYEVGDTLRVDDVMCTLGTVLFDHFYGGSNGGVWVGEPHASASEKQVLI